MSTTTPHRLPRPTLDVHAEVPSVVPPARTLPTPATSGVDQAVVDACHLLAADVDHLTVVLSERIARKEPYYVTTLSMPQLMASVRPNVLSILDAISGTGGDITAATRKTGRIRAEQGAPLSLVHRAYRLGMSFIWDELVRVMSRDSAHQAALLRSAAAFWKILDLYLEELSHAYREFEADQIQQDSRTRDVALTALFHGTHPPSLSMAGIAAALRLPTAGSFVVIATDPVPVGGDRTMVAIARAVVAAGGHMTWRSDPDGETALVVLSSRFSIDHLIAHLTSLSLGRVGVSETFDRLAATSLAATEARAARGVATPDARPGSTAVLRYAEVRVAVLLAAESDVAADLYRDVLGDVVDLPEVDQKMMLATLRAWFESGGSTAGAADLLHCHPNTVRYRLGKLSQLTGRNFTAPIDTVHLYLAMEAHRLLSPRPVA